MSEPTPNTLPIPLSSIVGVAIEHWRLSACLAGASGDGAGAARHALRRIAEFLKSCEVETASFDRKPYDPGIAAEVVDRIEDETLPADVTLIDETISPLVLWRGQVVKPAQIVTRVGANAEGSKE